MPLFHLGGVEKSHMVPAGVTTFTIQNLCEGSAYKIQVSSMAGTREGSSVLVTARTCEPFSFKFLDVKTVTNTPF